jgi:hypothetical protein
VRLKKARMIDSRRLHDACFNAAVAVSQAFIAVVAGVAVFRALVLSAAAGIALCSWAHWRLGKNKPAERRVKSDDGGSSYAESMWDRTAS